MDLSNSTTPLAKPNHTDHNHGDISDATMSVHVVLLVIAILGIIGNGLVIYVFLRANGKMDSSTKATINLAFTDLLTMTCILCMLILFNVTSSDYVCLSMTSTIYYLITVTQLVLLVITFDRYIAVRHPNRYSKLMNRRCLNTLLVSSWLIPAPLSILPFFGFNYMNKLQSCVPRTILHECIFIAQSVFFILVMILNLIFYIPIISKAVEFHQQTHPAKFHGVNASTARNKAKRRAIRNSFFIGFLTVFFMTCNLPYCIVRFRFGKDYSGGATAADITFLLGVINSLVNPFLYAYQKRFFRQKAKQFIKCKCSTTVNPNLTIQNTGQLRHEQVFLSLRSRLRTVNAFQEDELKNVDVESGNAKMASYINPGQVTWPSTSRDSFIQDILEPTEDEVEIIHLDTFREINPAHRTSTSRRSIQSDIYKKREEVGIIHYNICLGNPSAHLARLGAHRKPIPPVILVNDENKVESMCMGNQTARKAWSSTSRDLGVHDVYEKTKEV